MSFTYEPIGEILNITQLKDFFLSCNETEWNRMQSLPEMCPNTEIFFWSKYRKIRTRKNSVFRHFLSSEWMLRWSRVNLFNLNSFSEILVLLNNLGKIQEAFLYCIDINVAMQFLNLEICKVFRQLIDENVVFFSYNIAYMLNLLVHSIWQLQASHAL